MSCPSPREVPSRRFRTSEKRHSTPWKCKPGAEEIPGLPKYEHLHKALCPTSCEITRYQWLEQHPYAHRCSGDLYPSLSGRRSCITGKIQETKSGTSFLQHCNWTLFVDNKLHRASIWLQQWQPFSSYWFLDYYFFFFQSPLASLSVDILFGFFIIFSFKAYMQKHSKKMLAHPWTVFLHGEREIAKHILYFLL